MSKEIDRHSPGSFPRATVEYHSRLPNDKEKQTTESNSNEVEKTGQPPTRKSGGPRTPQGKARSKLNALKHGMLFKGVLLKGEQSADYFALLNGLREDYQLQGKLAETLIENLAVLIWRRRRFMQAEVAAISEKIEFMQSEYLTNQRVQAWDYSRTATACGGLLKHIDNPEVIKEAIHTLRILRSILTSHGFDGDLRFLKKLYGEDFDGGAAYGLPLFYEVKREGHRLSENGDNQTADAISTRSAIKMIEPEIERLQALEKRLEAECEQKIAYKSSAAIIPEQAVLDRLLRYETHLSREIGKTLDQLERLQQLRGDE